jgi:hypothetical protein
VSLSFNGMMPCSLCISADVHESQRALWHVAIILPILLIIPLMRYIVKVSSVIKALSQIKQEVVAKVIEDDDNVSYYNLSQRALSFTLCFCRLKSPASTCV